MSMPIKDPEKKREADRRYYSENKARIKARVSAYENQNKESVRAAHAAYYQKYKDVIKSRSRTWWKTNGRKASAEWVSRSRERRTVYRLSYMAGLTPKAKKSLNKSSLRSYHKSRKSLSESYVKRIFAQHTGLSIGEIPDDLVRIKRAHLQVTRKLRQLSK